MHSDYASHLRQALDRIRADGFYKTERVIQSPQSAAIRLVEGKEVLNFCANNYHGVADDPRMITGANDGPDHWGYGVALVRLVWGAEGVRDQLAMRLVRHRQTAD